MESVLPLRKMYLVVTCIVALVSVFPFTSARAEDVVPEEWFRAVSSAEDAQQIKTQLNTDLREKLHIEPYTIDGALSDRRAITANSKETYVVHSRAVVGFEAMPGIWENKKQDMIDFRGTTYPYSDVLLTVKETGDAQRKVANSDGAWTVTLPVDSLPQGEHTAYMQLESRQISSDLVPVAQFVVITDMHLSNTTWMFIIGAGGTLVLLSLVLAFEFVIWTREVM